MTNPEESSVDELTAKAEEARADFEENRNESETVSGGLESSNLLEEYSDPDTIPMAEHARVRDLLAQSNVAKTKQISELQAQQESARLSMLQAKDVVTDLQKQLTKAKIIIGTMVLEHETS